MQAIDLDSVFAIAGNVRHRRVFDEGVVLRQTDGEVLVVNDSAVEILDLIDGQTPVREVVNTLLSIYDADPEQLQQDLSLYLQELLELGILENAGEHVT